jgi:hypothetical protein
VPSRERGHGLRRRYFTGIGGQQRFNIAAIDLASGTHLGPTAIGDVNDLAVSGGVYARSYFTSIGGQPRNYIAALDAEGGEARPGTRMPRTGTRMPPSAHWR